MGLRRSSKVTTSLTYAQSLDIRPQ